MKKIVLVGLILCSVAETLMAQSFFAMRRSRSLILTVGTGTSSYFGELSNPGDYLQANLNFHAGLQYYLTNRIGIRGEVSWFQLSGDDKKASIESGRRGRNLSFNSNNFEISAIGIINLFPQGRSFYQRPGFNLYGFGGIGLLYFNPTTEFQGKKYQLRPQRTELVDYGPVTFVIPMGMGVRFKMGPFMNLSFEGGYRKTFTDYLDDVSTVHYDASKFPTALAYSLSDRRPEIGIAPAPEGNIRGNPKTDDGYALFSVKVEYYLPINFFQGNGQQKKFKNKRKSFYRYNKRGGLKK
ncbi:MAG: outer membrane beta-barrel protein [Cyclobacteriaceae bacterium]|nr:outer membrane beta-barrel protein [Cyclobacteriaceae bacterium]